MPLRIAEAPRIPVHAQAADRRPSRTRPDHEHGAIGRQQGFTLIELIVVIIILGILAAVAVPKFVDLSVEAHNASAKGVAGALASGTSINYAARVAGNASAVAVDYSNSCSAFLLQPLLTGGGVTLASTASTSNDVFQVSGTGDCSGTATSVVCTITPNGTGVTPVNATVICAR